MNTEYVEGEAFGSWDEFRFGHVLEAPQEKPRDPKAPNRSFIVKVAVVSGVVVPIMINAIAHAATPTSITPHSARGYQGGVPETAVLSNKPLDASVAESAGRVLSELVTSQTVASVFAPPEFLEIFEAIKAGRPIDATPEMKALARQAVQSASSAPKDRASIEAWARRIANAVAEAND